MGGRPALRLGKYDRWAFVACAMGLAIQVVAAACLPTRYFWDLAPYLHAARAFARGVDPYDVATYAKLGLGVSPERASLPFVYPPHTLFALVPLQSVSHGAAYAALLVFETLGLLAMATVWSREWVRPAERGALLLFAMFAFNASASLAFAAGNVAMFEALLLSLAFPMLARGRSGAFCALVSAASFFKLTPLVLLLAVAPLRGRRRWRHAALALAPYALATGLVVALRPELWRSFVAATRALGAAGLERGAINPSMRELFVDIAVLAGAPTSGALARGLFVAWVVVIAAVTGRTAMRVVRRGDATADDVQRYAALTCLAYALVLPRMKGYSYVLMVAPAFVVLSRHVSRARVWPLLAVAVLPNDVLANLLLGVPVEECPRDPLGLVLAYLPAISGFTLWVAAVRDGTSAVVREPASP